MTDETTTSIPTYVSLCSGYDGIGIGLKRAIPNLRTIAHCEIEAYAVANLIAKMEAGLLDACPVFTDLKQFPYRELCDKVTILSAGFPCQPFSSAGKRQATEDPRHLWPWIADGVTAMRPRYVWFENVEGIISAKTADGESVLKYVLGDLEKRGYSCTWGVFSASEVGAPHQRKRVFILGKLSDTNIERLERGLFRGESKEETKELITRRSKEDNELPNTKNVRCYRSVPIKNQKGAKRNDASREGSIKGMGTTELGDTSSERSCRGCEDSDRIKSEMLGSGLGKTRWPSRPGQQQYEWEEPRVTEAQSCVGLPANGTAFRVDELRLLGNGVVPDTCELAFKTLIQQL
jgi:DNA (cytosine-5)-methyltransferase 1